MVYEPREDSYLLKEAVVKYARGKVLDMGSGSGILAKAAARSMVDSVLAADIDEEAVKSSEAQGVEAVVSDLFENVRGEFDTIICNPPYLPIEEGEARDIALDGGRKGYEWTLRFLEQAATHLRRNGEILLLISTLTNQHVVERWLLDHAFAWEIVAHQKLPFEELMVYRIAWALPDRPKARFLGKGKRSRAYHDGDKVIKVEEERRVAQEALMLQKANELCIGPLYHSHGKDHLVMDFVDGVRIDRYINGAGKEEKERVLGEVMKQLEKLDAAGIDKTEMTNPYKHIIVSEKGPVLIDWERAKFSEKPQNVSQFKEYVKKVMQHE